jgi:hypothetical protein
MQRGGTNLNRLRRAAIWAPFLKAIPCAALGGYFMWSLTRPIYGFGWTLTLVVAVLWLIFGAGYLLAAFLLSRRSFLWRFSGGIIDATVTTVVALVFFWLAERSPANVNSCCQGDPNALPAVIFAAIGVAWIAASIPMLAWFLLGAAARFRRRRLPT